MIPTLLEDQLHRLLLMEELRRLEILTTSEAGPTYLPNWVGREGPQNREAAIRRLERLRLRRSAILSELGWLA